ncbi:MAG: pyridoxal-phosphate dependent enzyme [Gammaproteobacteria bacterium]|nr:pyridoxal-phosphate dependent enzyme [Gammaproteobacteria bacterium]
METDVPVLVVGGGPVGLTLAIDLAHRGQRVLLVEQRDGPSEHPKATLLGSRSMELFRRWGLDEEIFAAQMWLASNEGIFVEPASAASIAGLFKTLNPASGRAYDPGKIRDGARIVCTVTGHGLKDVDVAKDRCSGVINSKADRKEILHKIGL